MIPDTLYQVLYKVSGIIQGDSLCRYLGMITCIVGQPVRSEGGLAGSLLQRQPLSLRQKLRRCARLQARHYFYPARVFGLLCEGADEFGPFKCVDLKPPFPDSPARRLQIPFLPPFVGAAEEATGLRLRT